MGAKRPRLYLLPFTFIKNSFCGYPSLERWGGEKVYRGIRPSTPLAGAAFDQSGNWPVKAGLRLYRGVLPIFPSPLTFAEDTD
jgi:hypothetical protein